MFALAVIVSGAMLVWFVSNPLFDAVLDVLHMLRFEPLLLAVALVPMLQWLRAWRFAMLLHGSAALPGWRHFKLAAQLSVLNLMLPFKIGDFSFPLLARKQVGAGLLQGTVAILWCRLGDLCVVAGILLLGGAWLITPESRFGYHAALVGAGLACLVLPMALEPITSMLRSWRGFRRVLALLPPGAAMQYGQGPFLTLSLAIWATHSLIGYLAVRAVVDNVPPVAAAFASAASNLAFALPITGVAGLGPPQAAWTAGLHLTGVSWEISLATALLTHGCILMGAILAAIPTVVQLKIGGRAAIDG